MGIRDDLIRAMKKGEVTLMVMADFSKAFDTVHYGTLLTKLHTLGFSKSFLTWLTSYLSNRSHYVQIDDRSSSSHNIQFGVPQGSILGPLLFNLYVEDLQDIFPENITTFQYADDTNVYSSCRAVDLPILANGFNSTLEKLSSWSCNSNLALNPDKTKTMVISTRQMAHFHSLDTYEPNLHISQIMLQRVASARLLGVQLQQNLQWEEHINSISRSCYNTLCTLRKIKNFTDFKLRKYLAQSLILSKIDYCDTVFYPLPNCLMKRLQKLQFAAGSFVTGHYIKDTAEIVKIGWLPMKQRREYNLLKLVYKALYLPSWPSYLKLKLVPIVRTLRSNSAKRLVVPLEKGTFQDSAAELFNSLPDHIRNSQDRNYYLREVHKYLEHSINHN